MKTPVILFADPTKNTMHFQIQDALLTGCCSILGQITLSLASKSRLWPLLRSTWRRGTNIGRCWDMLRYYILHYSIRLLSYHYHIVLIVFITISNYFVLSSINYSVITLIVIIIIKYCTFYIARMFTCVWPYLPMVPISRTCDSGKTTSATARRWVPTVPERLIFFCRRATWK